MTIEKVIELLIREYWFEDAELKEAKRIAVEILYPYTLPYLSYGGNEMPKGEEE